MHKPTGNGDMKTGNSETRDTFSKSLMCFGTAAMFVVLPYGDHHLITSLEKSKAFSVCNSVQVCLCNRLLWCQMFLV